ncbi:RUN domain-containing protein 1 [Chionoecetes opilio]|uniref:RUN domain-containing protein 1 n=1 Tax=Chionoecetes opilio TaxID=41210 RepID=A0A8J5CPD4_CHIOP|nr:RUN domain-containing protein 1 [Chionoecetes opilio]
MAADDLVLDMIKTHSHYDVPEDIILSSHDDSDCPDLPRETPSTLRPVKNVEKDINGLLREANISRWPGDRIAARHWTTEDTIIPDWSIHKDAIIEGFQKRKPDGAGCKPTHKEESRSWKSDEEDLVSHKIGREGSVSHKIDQVCPESHQFSQEGTAKHMIGPESQQFSQEGTAKHMIGQESHQISQEGIAKHMIGPESQQFSQEGTAKHMIGPESQQFSQEGTAKHMIGPESQQFSQEGTAKHMIGPESQQFSQEGTAKRIISQESLTDDLTSTHKYKSDGSQLELMTNASSGQAGSEADDDWWDGEGRPTGERWPPLGAPDDQAEDSSFESWYRQGRSCEGTEGVGEVERERLRQLEEEQDQLSNSLMALTSHFAQVQFRLKQIVDASPEQKEGLLSQLELFANRGIPDMRAPNAACLSLKQQLDDLELYVYETGEGGPPQAQIMERQRVIIEQLKDRLNLNVDEMDQLTLEDLRRQVDRAVRELEAY